MNETTMLRRIVCNDCGSLVGALMIRDNDFIRQPCLRQQRVESLPKIASLIARRNSHENRRGLAM